MNAHDFLTDRKADRAWLFRLFDRMKYARVEQDSRFGD